VVVRCVVVRDVVVRDVVVRDVVGAMCGCACVVVQCLVCDDNSDGDDDGGMQCLVFGVIVRCMMYDVRCVMCDV